MSSEPAAIRGCPGCARSVRAGIPSCPHCGAMLTIGVTLNWMDGKKETVRVEVPSSDD